MHPPAHATAHVFNLDSWIEFVALSPPLFPALTFAVLGLWMLLGSPPKERWVARAASVAFTLSVSAALSVCAYFLLHDDRPIHITLGPWFASNGYEFAGTLLIDRLSVPMMALTAVICGAIGRFSATYLVGEPGQQRFYLLLNLFASGMFLLVMAGSLDLLIVGWELVGLSSMLLIGFFQRRTSSVRNALRAFVVYRVCDIGLLVGTVLMHLYAHTTIFAEAFGLDRWPDGVIQPQSSAVAATLTTLCLFWAACGKSALFPMGSWLPRAMEGPTPSSAVFYGALSVHAGLYLLLRIHPLLEQSSTARAVVFAVGLATALHGTLVARVQTDIKSQLAYATTTQVGVIAMEIGAGLPKLALLHLVSHALLRTLQFLRAPNALTEALHLRASVDYIPRRFALPLLPERWANHVYHLSLERFHLDGFWERMVALPILQAAQRIDRAELLWIDRLAGTAATGKQNLGAVDAGVVSQDPTPQPPNSQNPGQP